jgi:DNA-binding LacI/PurR family transcriptional regulator
MKRATIRDVAVSAGVSLSTVSRVIHGHPAVDSALQKRVMEAVARLNYQPNRSAQSLRSPVNSVIGLVISDIENPFFTSIVRGVEDVAYDNQMTVILCSTDEDPVKQERRLEVMAKERVAGLIIAPAHGDSAPSLHRLQASGMPVVLLDRNISDGELDAVMVDNVEGAYTATRHLINLKRQRIALVNGDSRIKTFADRYKGYRKALAEANLPLNEAYITEVDPKIDRGLKATLKLLQREPRPDAIFASNNMITVGVLKAIRQLKLKIPEEVALVGFDDMPWSSELCPPVTSIAQPTYELGREAGRLLIRRLQDPGGFQQTIVLHTRLIVRESCGAHLQTAAIEGI